MIDLNDDMMNKYIDGELTNEMMQQVKRMLDSSPEDLYRYKMLLSIHNRLKNLPGEEVSPNFTNNIMLKVQRNLKRKKEQNFFMVSVLSLFLLISLGIVAYILSNYLLIQPSNSSDVFNQLTERSDDFISLLKNFFSKRNISVLGSVFSFILLVSGYFFYDSLKHSKR